MLPGLILFGQNLMQLFPHPNNAPDKNWFWLRSWSKEIFMLESVDAQTKDWRTLYQV